MSCCPEHKPCGKNLGCLNQTDAKCVFLNNCDLAELLNISCGDNLESVIEALLNAITSGITAALGADCIDGGDPFDINTWLENAEAYICNINPIVNIELNGNVITYTFHDGTTIEIDLGAIIAPITKVQDTIFVDSIYGDNGTGLREDRTKPFETVDAALAVMEEDDIIQIINSSSTYTILGTTIAGISRNAFRFHLEQGVEIILDINAAGVLDFQGKTIEIVGRKGLDNDLVITSPDHYYHNLNLFVKNIDKIQASLKLRSNCSSSWENIQELEFEQLIFSDSFDSAFSQPFPAGTHKFSNISEMGGFSLAKLSAPSNKRYSIDLTQSKYQGNYFIQYENTEGTDYESFINIINSEIFTKSSAFGGTKRNRKARDYFKNTNILSGEGAAYSISDDHEGIIKMINTRLEGAIELDIAQTQLNLVDAELQDVWSNQYPSNPMTTREPIIEHLHIDGEDGTKNITFAQSPYTMGPESTLLVDSSAGDVTINFPKANRISKEITLIGVGGSNNMIIVPDGAELINGAASKTLPTLSTTIIKVKSDRLNLYGWATMSF